MSENKAASRYAKSLIDLSSEQNALESVKNDMVRIEQAIEHNSELKAVLQNPVITPDKKAAILGGIFNADVNQVTAAYLKLLVSKGRADILFDTTRAFIRQYDLIRGIVTADVAAATPLTAANRAEIIAVVQKETGAKEVVIREKVNAELIGGFILKVGDKQFDASIAGSLRKLKKELGQGVV